MSNQSDVCSKCGGRSVVKGEIDLRTSKDLELIMVVRKNHGVEKKVPLQPKVCGKCGFVDFYVQEPKKLRILSADKPIDPNFKQRPILEYDF